jgi:hypothetical protein
MHPFIEHAATAVALGATATALTDLWTLARKRAFGTPMPDYALVGRWFAHMGRGVFRHRSIAEAAAIRGERSLGWAIHYATGIAFAALLLWATGVQWLQQPTPAPAIAFGLATVAAPFLLMQPAMGAGIAASRTRFPARARIQSLVTHAVFGAGLYVAASAAHLMMS